MAVYKRRYRVYQGSLTPAWSRFAVLTRYSLSSLFRSRLFTGYFVLCCIPLLVGITYIYFAHSQLAQAMFGIRVNGSWGINNTWFAIMLQVQTGLGFIIVAWAAPGMITRDLANQALQLYFSRPLTRIEYIAGKMAVLAFLLSCTTWIPSLLLFGLQAQMAGNGWGWDNLFLTGAIFISSWLWIAVISLLALALSVFVRWRIAATGLIIGIMFVLPGFAEAINFTLQTYWGRLLNISYTIRVVWAHLFRTEPRNMGVIFQSEIPLWSAWASILAACLVSLFLLNRRLKAREVVRG
ncbi:MAG TPA: ABC transporter permease subunit [Candidatus Angelobacter sp.]